MAPRLLLASVLLLGACSSSEPKPAASAAGPAKLTPADCESRLKAHGSLCADGDKAMEANKSMIADTCPKIDQKPATAEWVACFTDISTKDKCGEVAVKCQPLYDKMVASKAP